MSKISTYELELIRPGDVNGPKLQTTLPLGPFVKGQKITFPTGTVQGTFTIKGVETVIDEQSSSVCQLIRLFLG